MFKLLAVDVPSAAGSEQRIYLEGDARVYDRGSVMRELRDPFLNVRCPLLCLGVFWVFGVGAVFGVRAGACALLFRVRSALRASGRTQ